MSTMQVTLPDALQDFVNAQVTARGYSSSSEFICELIRKELDRQRLRELILDGAASTRGVVVDVEYFQGLRSRIFSDASRQ